MGPGSKKLGRDTMIEDAFEWIDATMEEAEETFNGDGWGKGGVIFVGEGFDFKSGLLEVEKSAACS